MGRWAQAQRRGTVAPGETVGGIGAPDPSSMATDCLADVRNFLWDGVQPAGTDGIFLRVSSDGGIDWDIKDDANLYSVFTTTGVDVVDDGCGTANAWQIAFSNASLPVGPFCPIQTLP